MKPAEFLKYISIDEHSATPKYIQLSNSIIAALESGKLTKDDALPSINDLSFALEISRDTAEKGYKYLKKRGVILSVPGRGYYIGHSDYKNKIKVFLLFNKLSVHKKMIYDSLVAALGEDALIDFYIYNNDYKIFKRLILNKRTDYSHCVIIPHFIEGGEEAYQIINTIPKEKLILLDKMLPGVEGSYSSIYEDFENDLYGALVTAKESLSKYHTIKLIFPRKSYFPIEIIRGFTHFCQEYAFNHAIINDIKIEPINEGEVFINLMEDDLVILLERIILLKLKMGKDVGVISYNETPLKKIILNGITTISSDFKAMGELLAEMIQKQNKAHLNVPFHLKLRASL